MADTPIEITVTPPRRTASEDTTVVRAGLAPFAHHGFVNPPVYRGSTVLFPTLDAFEQPTQKYTYGIHGTPTTDALESAIAELEGGVRTFLTSSGLSALTTAMLAFVAAGDHILVPDNAYYPTRRFCDETLKRFGVETTYYDPLLAGEIRTLIRPNTRFIHTESPGSRTFEIQDIPAIVAAAREHYVRVLMDNTWASPVFFKPFAHGVDVSIQAATKYICGHSDAMLGAVTVNAATLEAVKAMRVHLGDCPGSEETFLGLRGIRTIRVRLERQQASGLEMGRWLEAQPEVARVVHPGLPSHPGHDLWKRDFLGCSSLFSIVLRPVSKPQLAAFVNGLELFGMGYSFGGYESLIMPFDPAATRTVTTWPAEGPALRIHIGLEDTHDLKADLKAGFARMQLAD